MFKLPLIHPNGFDNQWLETTTQSAPVEERGHFFMAQPPLLREEGDYVFLTPTNSTHPNSSLTRSRRLLTGGQAKPEPRKPLRRHS